MKLTVSEARELVDACMRAVGHDADEAATIADHLIDCELRGVSFGGLPRALSVIDQVRAMKSPRRPITTLHETPVSAMLDGGLQVGYLVGSRATGIAIDKARTNGIAVVGASKTWYTGMFSYYLERVVAAGFVGMVAGSGSFKVAPHGGTEGRYSTNPIAFGFPSTTTPVIWDIGTSSVMVGEVVLANRLGRPLDEGLAYDRDGNPTRDPAAALQGAFTVWGGHKGSGLAMSVQMLAMLGGQAVNAGNLEDCGFLIVVMDPGLLGPADDFKARVSEYAALMRATRPADPARPVRVPFDRSIAERERRLAADTIDVADPIHQALLRVAGRAA
jgi:LDH2 family malate/lactate/ureidoglycolate dehydrogenase